MSRPEREKKAITLLDVFGLERYARSYPHQLSGGMRQRAAFLRTALHGRELWLLDEPFARLDAITRHDMQKWLLSIRARFHQAVLLVTHDIDEAIVLSDRIYVMSTAPGCIIAEVTVTPSQRNREDSAYTTLKHDLTGLLEPGGNA
jgi:ABC-type nitrate/sulfonate/bicarbonate transport system ATPase subunit